MEFLQWKSFYKSNAPEWNIVIWSFFQNDLKLRYSYSNLKRFGFLNIFPVQDTCVWKSWLNILIKKIEKIVLTLFLTHILNHRKLISVQENEHNQMPLACNVVVVLTNYKVKFNYNSLGAIILYCLSYAFTCLFWHFIAISLLFILQWK